jgi:hypothetical protein
VIWTSPTTNNLWKTLSEIPDSPGSPQSMLKTSTPQTSTVTATNNLWNTPTPQTSIATATATLGKRPFNPFQTLGIPESIFKTSSVSQTPVTESMVCCTMSVMRDKLRCVSVAHNDVFVSVPPAPLDSSHRQHEKRARNRHASSAALARKARSAGIHFPVRRETEGSPNQTDIASAQHRHQTPLLEELSTASTLQLSSSRGLASANVPQHIRPCYLLVTLGFLVIGGSLAVGLFYSIAKDRMGDGFTTAGWMTAVGTLILAAPMAKHFPHCRCWETGNTVLRHGHNAQV